LLGHTGTEEALYILQSASCRSFQRLDVHEAELLKLIGHLTPDRHYYPSHLWSMARVSWKDLPALSQHHGFFQIVSSLFDHASSLEALYDQPAIFYISSGNVLLLNRAASRNKSYYPPDSQILQRPSSPVDVMYKSRDVSDVGTAAHVAFRTSWSIWNDRPSLEGGLQNIWDIMNSWGSVGPADRDSGLALGYSRHWLKFDAARDWFVIYDLCRNAISGCSRKSRIQLCFSLSAAAYGESNYSGILPFLVTFSLDERLCRLDPPSDRSYLLSDGVAPDFARLKSMVLASKLPIESTPAHGLPLGWPRNSKYNNTIERESSRVAETLLRQWPRYQYEGLPEEWFDKRDFNRRIEEYAQSLLRNVRLKDHAEQLESVLQKYRHVNIPFPAPYILPPQSITRQSKAPSYSLPDILISRANVPTPSADGEPSLCRRKAAEPSPPASSNSLKRLIDEFRNSRQPLQRDYGDELNKSYFKLLSQDASQHAQGAIPSHDHLVSYHNECSRRKVHQFSEISVCLMPLPNEEETNGVAGLWPRITPRSLLRQLARDRINELPAKWRSVFIHYAIALLRYRHSIRLLELSLRKRHEELLRELDATHNEVLAEANPDWLLVQVRPIPCL
jgi:hypothetical protein